MSDFRGFSTISEQLLREEVVKIWNANIELQIAGQLQIEPQGMKPPVTICEIRGIGGQYNLFLAKDNKKLIILNP
ncbi:MAG: hypothetical protein V7L05_26425 [Nostoc sp.]|uniref:hypothetical protein n=1 Tax=Nostoc sp. TaxID=1180 RepID=UPI002FF5D0EE